MASSDKVQATMQKINEEKEQKGKVVVVVAEGAAGGVSKKEKETERGKETYKWRQEQKD